MGFFPYLRLARLPQQPHKETEDVIVMRKHLRRAWAAWGLTPGHRRPNTSEKSGDGSTEREGEEPAFHRSQSRLDAIEIGAGC